MTSKVVIDELNPQLIDRHWIVEARDKKGEDWYRFGGKHDNRLTAEAYRVGVCLYKARHRKARIVEVTTYRRVLALESQGNTACQSTTPR